MIKLLADGPKVGIGSPRFNTWPHIAAKLRPTYISVMMTSRYLSLSFLEKNSLFIIPTALSHHHQIRRGGGMAERYPGWQCVPDISHFCHLVNRVAGLFGLVSPGLSNYCPPSEKCLPTSLKAITETSHVTRRRCIPRRRKKMTYTSLIIFGFGAVPR